MSKTGHINDFERKDTNICHADENQPLGRLLWLLCNNVRGRFQIKSGMTPLWDKTAFTLIELLVVVLIIGILAVIALPQYQKAVEKSRFIQLVTIAKSISTAQQLYYLTNGSYSRDPKVLDLSFQLSVNGKTVTFPGGVCDFVYSQGLGGTPRISCTLFKPRIAWQHAYNKKGFTCCSYPNDSFRGDWLCRWVLKTQTPYLDNATYRCYSGKELAF